MNDLLITELAVIRKTDIIGLTLEYGWTIEANLGNSKDNITLTPNLNYEAAVDKFNQIITQLGNQQSWFHYINIDGRERTYWKKSDIRKIFCKGSQHHYRIYLDSFSQECRLENNLSYSLVCNIFKQISGQFLSDDWLEAKMAIIRKSDLIVILENFSYIYALVNDSEILLNDIGCGSFSAYFKELAKDFDEDSWFLDDHIIIRRSELNCFVIREGHWLYAHLKSGRFVRCSSERLSPDNFSIVLQKYSKELIQKTSKFAGKRKNKE